MLKRVFLFLFIIFSVGLYSQVEKDTIDNKYLEDQLYLSFAFNIFSDKPANDSKSLFSIEMSTGFIKDIPFNKERNFGIGIGIGYSLSSYKKELELTLTQNNITTTYLTEKFRTHSLEFPFEIRWRNSTPTKYKFWRIYLGAKFSYLLKSKAKLNFQDEITSFRNLSEFNKTKYGLTLSVGYSSWNLYLYYGLKPLFENTYLNGEKLNIKDFNIGLKFYLL